MMLQINPEIFKNFDIRGVYPNELNASVARGLGNAFSLCFAPRVVSVGCDARLSSPEIHSELVAGLIECGTDVVDLGIITTEMHWFASGKYKYDLSLMVTASHNPSEWNGIKIARSGAVAMSGETGIFKLKDFVNGEVEIPKNKIGDITKKDITLDWKHHCLEFVNTKSLNSKKFVVDSGNGVAGNIFAKVTEGLELNYSPLFFDEDGSFPGRGPNPEKPGALAKLKDEILGKNADFGLAFDGDGDRVILVNENGKAYSGSVLHAALAKLMLEKYPGETILYTSCSGIIVPEIIAKYGGKSQRVMVGHSIIKQKMRELNAIFAGEHSGHYYYRDNYFADSGLITALLLIEYFSNSKKPVSEIMAEFDTHFSSGEINIKIKDREKIVPMILASFTDAKYKDDFDGATVYYNDWWFNVRKSSVEPVIHLIVEADSESILTEKMEFVSQFIQNI